MGQSLYSASARAQLVSMTEAATTAYIGSLAAEMFADPKAVENIEIMTEALATSIKKLAEKSGCTDAILRSFALNILDDVKE